MHRAPRGGEGRGEGGRQLLVLGWKPQGAPPHTVLCPQILYFPDRWWHATLNLDTSVFISTFLG